ncbi:magnesium-translocating P-type ATPase [Streptomyces sp. NPDC047002]|uniref:magnesium-translocating P-type ATPase n=1 Tax=Streptomyces sp. NPDC047002 TaxID=3155475 RepID=UPI003454D147
MRTSEPPPAGAAPAAHPRPGRREGTAATTAVTTLEVLRRLGTGPRGLTEAEAEDRLVRHGENTLPAARTAPLLRRFLGGVRDPFTGVLLCLAAVSAAVTSWGTACVLTVLVAVSCALRARAGRQADRSAAALHGALPSTATVRRRAGPSYTETREREVPACDLVPGDIVRLAPGDLVPADVRLLRATGLSVHQAALTGESVPVAKHPVDDPEGPGGPGSRAPAAADAFEAPHLCFQGSSVAAGSATAVVTATGPGTRFATAHGTDHEHGPRQGGVERPFDRSVKGVVWLLVRLMALTPPLVLAAGALLHRSSPESPAFAVAVAVGLTPEMLPVVVNTVLARGAGRLAGRYGVIVKRLPALHDLGAVEVLCTDKTGTLTQDLPVLDRTLAPDGGPCPEALAWAAVNSLVTLQLAEVPQPDPLDEAVLAAAPPGAADRYEGVAALPLDPVRRRSAALVRDGSGHTLAVKGAPEDVLDRCTRLRTREGTAALDPAARARLDRLAADAAGEGLRVLAVAVGDLPLRPRPLTSAAESGLTLVGFVALRDALAPTAADALASLARRGVSLAVLTGDHPGTAARVCRDLGLTVAPEAVVTGDTVDALDDAELAALAARTTVFARCAPEHKARVVRALRAAGRTTGYLGDGVNDLPALRAADLGICTKDAAQVAREAAGVVLATKDLTALSHAVAYGRRASADIVTYLRITLSSNVGNVIAMLGAGLLLPFLPMLPAQVLLQNLCFDAAQLTLALDRPPASAADRPATLRPAGLLRTVAGYGVLNAAADLATFGVIALTGHPGAHAGGEAAFHAGWFTENLLTQALVMLLLRPRGGATPAPVRAAAAFLAAVGVALPLLPAGASFGMAPPPPAYYPLLAALLALYGAALACARARRAPRGAETGRAPGPSGQADGACTGAVSRHAEGAAPGPFGPGDGARARVR